VSLAFINLHGDVDSVTLSPDNDDKVSRLGSYIGYDSRDAPTDTRRGWWNELALTWELGIFENSSSFGQVDLDLRRYVPLGSRGALALFSLTTLRTGRVGKEVAVWQQFGAGGTNTIRGHDYAVQIGKQQFINTVEYRYTLVEPRLLRLPFGINYRGGLSVAVYADAGLAWSESNQFATDNFITGGGVGVRVLLPVISMLRFDLGWGQTGRGVFVHIGGFEKSVMARQRVR
jgi:outer membrane protein assembly factor BamA